MNCEQKKVRKFYKELHSFSADNIGMWIAAGFMEFFYVIFMAIPYQEMAEEGAFVIFLILCGFAGPLFYLHPYIYYREDGQSHYIYECIKYLPIDYREIKKMRIIYLAKFVGKIAPLLFLVQFLTSAFSYEITIENILYAIFFAVVWPFVSNLPFAGGNK